MPTDAQPQPGVTQLHVKLCVMYAAMFVMYGASLTYLPVWLDARGLSPAEIAFATSAPLFLRLAVTPAIGFAADNAQAHRAMLIALGAVAVLLVAALAHSPAGVILVALTALTLVSVQTMMPLSDTIAMTAARTHTAIDYGRVRLWGSLTFILASYLAGYVASTAGPESIIWVLLAGAMLTCCAFLALPRPERAGADAARSAVGRLAVADVLALLRAPGFALFLIASGSIQASHAMFYVFGVLHWREQHLSAGLIGTLWAIGVTAEIALFWLARHVAKIGELRLMMLGAIAGIVRWTAMAFDPPAALLVPLQILHGGTFAATHLGAMHWISANVPTRMAGTAQALLSTFTAGIAMGSATMLSGPLYDAFGGAAYVAMALSCAIGLAASLALAARAGPAPRRPTSAP